MTGVPVNDVAKILFPTFKIALPNVTKYTKKLNWIKRFYRAN